MGKINRNVLYYIPWVLFSLAIIYVSHQEKIEFVNGTFYLKDKIFHLIAYFFYGITIQFALISEENYKRISFIWKIILIGSLFGLSDEIHQYFIKGRSAEFLDWLADTLGVTLSLLFKNLIFNIKHTKEIDQPK